MAKQKGKGGAKKSNNNNNNNNKGGRSNSNNKNNHLDFNPNSNHNGNGNGKSKKRNNKNKYQQADEDDANFRSTLQNQGNIIREMTSDGNCLFRSLSDQLYDDVGAKHDVVRHDVCNHLSKHKEEFMHFLLLDDDDEDVVDIDEYIAKMREDGEWGGNVEIVVASRVYARNIIVFAGEYSNGALSIQFDDKERDGNGNENENGNDLLLSYHGNDHYNSVHPINGGSGCRKQSAKSNNSSSGSASTKSNRKKGQSSQKNDDNSETDNSRAKDTTQSSSTTTATIEKRMSKPPTRGSNCPCRSGLKYKKCCMVTEKSKKRLAKHLEKHGTGDVDASPNIDEKKEDEFIGDFKVLTI